MQFSDSQGKQYASPLLKVLHSSPRRGEIYLLPVIQFIINKIFRAQLLKQLQHKPKSDFFNIIQPLKSIYSEYLDMEPLTFYDRRFWNHKNRNYDLVFGFEGLGDTFLHFPFLSSYIFPLTLYQWILIPGFFPFQS